MKKKKRLTILMLVALMAIVSVAGYVTYARYQSQGEGTTEVPVAGWEVSVNGVDITPANATEFALGLTWEGLTDLVVPNLIAPGMTATTAITINPAGSQVGMNYWIDFDMTELTNDNIFIKSVKVGETELEKVALGTCAGGAGATQTECEGNSGVWTASTDPHAGEYTGTIALPGEAGAKTLMTAAQTVNAEIEVEWHDYNDSDNNAEDTATGTAAVASNITATVTVEQDME